MLVPGQSVIDVIFGSENSGGFFVEVRFVVPVPHYFENGVTLSGKSVPCRLVPARFIDFTEVPGCLSLRPGVRPDGQARDRGYRRRRDRLAVFREPVRECRQRLADERRVLGVQRERAAEGMDADAPLFRGRRVRAVGSTGAGA